MFKALAEAWTSDQSHFPCRQRCVYGVSYFTKYLDRVPLHGNKLFSMGKQPVSELRPFRNGIGAIQIKKCDPIEVVVTIRRGKVFEPIFWHGGNFPATMIFDPNTEGKNCLGREAR